MSARILTVNGGSSSIKFALFETGHAPRWVLHGSVERIGLPGVALIVKGLQPEASISGFFAGNAAARAGVGYMIWVSSPNNNSVHGTAAFTKN